MSFSINYLSYGSINLGSFDLSWRHQLHQLEEEEERSCMVIRFVEFFNWCVYVVWFYRQYEAECSSVAYFGDGMLCLPLFGNLHVKSN